MNFRGDTIQSILFYFFIFFNFIYLILAVLGLRFCARAFSSCGERGPLTIAASPVAEHRLQTRRLSNCGSRAQLLRGMWDLPRPGLEPVSPALAGRFSTHCATREALNPFQYGKLKCVGCCRKVFVLFLINCSCEIVFLASKMMSYAIFLELR